MKIPLDYICIKSGILCPRCRRLIETGQVAEYEVDVMKALIELEERDPQFRFLRESTYIKGYRVGELLVLLLELPDTVSQQSLIRLARLLSDRMGLKVRIVRKSNDVKAMIAQILAPARILGINTIWSPDGSVQHVVRVSRHDARFLPASINDLEQLLITIFNEPYRIRVI